MQCGVRDMGLREGVGRFRLAPSASQPAGVLHPASFSPRVLRARIEWNGFPPGRAAALPGPANAHGSAATKRGLRFEAKVTASLNRLFPSRFVSQLPLSFQTAQKRGRAIPDGFLLSRDGSALCVIEMKAAHTTDAWWQLERFYAPIAREAFRGLRIVLLEICGTYDPHVRLPKRVALLESVEEVFSTRECYHCIYVTRSGGLDACSTSG